jgi:hypothetical protein
MPICRALSFMPSMTYRSLTPANSLREAERGGALLLYGSLPPAKIAFRPWYADRALSELARSKSTGAGSA